MTAHTLHVKIKLKSPLLLGTDRDYSLFLETRDYVPGGVLRGSLARLLLERDDAQTRQDFNALFDASALSPIFENLYPTWSESPTYPLPLSARACKHHGGFNTPKKPRHGIGDILIRQAVFEDLLLTANLPLLYTPRCPRCGEDVTPPSTRFYESTGKTYRPVSVPVRRFSRTAINRRRYTAADQLLYTLETIAPGRLRDGGQAPLFFRGAVHCQPSQKSVLERWLPQIAWVGRSRSRGLGQIELDLLQDSFDIEMGAPPPLKDRLAQFDRAARQEWGFYERMAGVAPLAKNVHFFSLDLLSPAIFTRCGLPAAVPDLADLGLGPANASIYRAFTDRYVIGGWHMGQGLPRRTLLATALGSVYMIKTTNLSLDELADRLQPLETLGLGDQRERGFGRVSISSPFHYQPEVDL